MKNPYNLKQLILFITMVCISTALFSQSNTTGKNYKKGAKALEQEKYQDAISYFTLSIEQFPSAKAFLSRSEAYYAIGDSCAFCNDLMESSKLNNAEAYKKYKEKCRYTNTMKNLPDSISKSHPNVIRIEITYNKCSSDSSIIAVSENQDEEIWKNEISEIEDVPIYTIVESMPKYFGGDDARNHFLESNIIYPEKEILKGIQGTVYVSFVVDIDGSVTRVRILKGLSKSIDQEAIRVVKLMPKWTPGMQNKKPIRVMFNMPIYFKIKR